MYGSRLNLVDVWVGVFSLALHGRYCTPLIFSSLMNEQQKPSWGFPACNQQGWVGGWGGSHVLILASMLSGWITHPHTCLASTIHCHRMTLQ